MAGPDAKQAALHLGHYFPEDPAVPLNSPHVPGSEAAVLSL